MENFNWLQEKVDIWLQKAWDIVDMLKKIDVSKLREWLNSPDFTSKIHSIIWSDGVNFLSKIMHKWASMLSSLADGTSKFWQILKWWWVWANDAQKWVNSLPETKPKEVISESDIIKIWLDISKICQKIVSGWTEDINKNTDLVVSNIDRLEKQWVNINDTCMIMPNDSSFIKKLWIDPKEAEKFQKTADWSILIPYSSLRDWLKNTTQNKESSNDGVDFKNNVNEIWDKVLSSAKELERRIKNLNPLSWWINWNIEKWVKMWESWLSENMWNFDTISQSKKQLNPETHRELLWFLNKAESSINSWLSSFLVSSWNKESLWLLAKEVSKVKSKIA